MSEKVRSFKKFISKKYYNELFEAIEVFVENNHMSLDIIFKKFEEYDSCEVDDIKINHVYIDGKFNGEDSIIYVVVSADLVLLQSTRHYDDYEGINKWFLIICSGSLDNNLESLRIIDVEEYSSKPSVENSISDDLVPIMSKNDYDKFATEFLNDCYPEALDQKNPKAIDPYILADKLGLKVITRNLSKDCSIFGQIIFANCIITTFDGDEIIDEIVEEGTIIVDPNVFFLRNLGSLNNTIVHECVHWYFHRKGFQLEKLYDSELTKLSCVVTGGIEGKNTESLMWMERQANALAPRILMPYTTFKLKCSEYIKKYAFDRGSRDLIDYVEDVITDLADYFGVSRQSSKIRMIETGYEEAKGAFVYIDGRYIPPHYDYKYRLKEKETYSISLLDLARLKVFNPKFREILNSGLYQYVDSHICINHPIYIEEDFVGNPQLTRYARTHMKECCLVFGVESVNKNINSSIVTQCYLCREDFGMEINLTFPEDSNKNNLSDEEYNKLLAKKAKQFTTETMKVVKDMPSTFEESVEYLIDWSEMTQKDIAEKSYLSERTIRRMKDSTDKEYNPSLRTIIAFCVGIKAPPQISYALIDRSNFRIQFNNEEGILFSLILSSMYTKPLDRANEAMIEAGFDPISTNY